MKKRILAMLLTVVVVIGLVPFVSVTANAVSQQQAIEWLRQQANNGARYDIDSKYGMQCSDFGTAYINWLISGSTALHSPYTTYNGKQYWGLSYPGWQKIAYYSGFVPQPGDILCFDATPSVPNGHVSVAIEGCTSTKMSAVGQTGNRQTHYQSGAYNGPYGKIQGVVRPTFDAIQPPSPPSSASISSNYAGIDATISSSWTAVSGANRYSVALFRDGVQIEDYELTGTSRNFTANSPGQYYIRVRSGNSAGWSGYRDSAAITINPDKTVTFADHDGSEIKIQTVHHGTGATAPYAPSREGHTFQGWDKSFSNITADTTVTAVYSINRYTVRFWDKDGNILSTQTVDWSSAAVPPAAPSLSGWEFVDWDSHDYENVKSNMDITAVYKWGNPNLPHVLTITQAIREEDHEGYNVRVGLVDNDPIGTTRGRVIVTLKTEAGKVVATEVTTYTLQELKDGAKQIYVPYSGVATTAEVSLVGLLADGNTGVPLAQMAASVIDLGEPWSDWSTNPPPTGDGYLTESRDEYRYRDKQTTTSSSPTMSGWTLYDTTWVWGDWSAWSKTERIETDDRQIEKRTIPATYKTVYQYYHYCRAGGYYSNYPSSSYTHLHVIETEKMPTATNQDGYTPGGSIPFWRFSPCANNVNVWFPGTQYTGQPRGVFSKTVTVTPAYNEWRYRDKLYTYYFEKWGDWEDWETGTAPAATASKEVETRTVHRFKANDIKLTAYNYERYKYTNLATSDTHYLSDSTYPDIAGFPGEWQYAKTYAPKPAFVSGGIEIIFGSPDDPWFLATPYITYDTLEDTSGEERHISGSIGAATSGKLATLLVFRQTNQDPTASQLEYVDQATLGAQGDYDFTYRTKDEPSALTGDFIIMLAVEGGTSPVYIGRVEAPKPIYTVVFADENGAEISRQSVIEGQSAVLPENPKKEGYNFNGWDDSTTNIRQDMTFAATYAKKKFSVVFVDWENNDVEVREYEYGDLLLMENIPDKEGSSFAGWSTLNGDDVTTVKQNMIVTARYDLNTYTVTFLNWSGEVISEQIVEYGGEADIPEIEEPAEADRVFKEWSQPYAALYVVEDLILMPISMFTQTVEMPEISLPSGNYAGTQTITLTCSTPNAKIYFTTDGTIPEYAVDEVGTYTNGNLYYAPITITSETELLAVAFVDGMNPSLCADEYYSYSTDESCATPTANPSGGQVAPGTMVTLSCVTPGATIRYTTNGSDPTTISTVYTSPIVINDATTIKARAFANGMTDSDVATFVYTVIPSSDSLTFAVDNVKTRAGAYVEVPIRITNNPGISVISALRVDFNSNMLEWNYNPATYGANPNTWPFVAANLSPAYGEGIVPLSGRPQGANISSSHIVFDFMDSSEPFASHDNGVLVTLKFKVKDDVEAGATIPITITVAGVGNLTGDMFPFQIVNGAVTVQNILYGDVNQNGRVDIFDVQALLLWVNSGGSIGDIDETAGRITSAAGPPDIFDVQALLLWVNSGGDPVIGHPGPNP